MDLVEQGAKIAINCNECNNPEIEMGNEDVVEIYNKFTPIRSDGFNKPMIDIGAVKFLMEVYGVNKKDWRNFLENMIYYHSCLNKE